MKNKTEKNELEKIEILQQPTSEMEIKNPEESTDSHKENNHNKYVNGDVMNSVIEKSKAFVSSNFTTKGSLLENGVALHEELSKIKKENYPSKEDAIVFFKTTNNLNYDFICQNFLIKNGILITTSILEITHLFDEIEEGTLVVTLPHTAQGYRKLNHYKPETIVKYKERWVNYSNLKTMVKNDNLKPFTEKCIKNK